mmetsp:Transcript_25298/g.75162  ORF Transcript_25298/g.75162 Transcript_25298/m.75162 type:complete len:308 (+) Transcript_25298:137-1060(+)
MLQRSGSKRRRRSGSRRGCASASWAPVLASEATRHPTRSGAGSRRAMQPSLRPRWSGAQRVAAARSSGAEVAAAEPLERRARTCSAASVGAATRLRGGGASKRRPTRPSCSLRQGRRARAGPPSRPRSRRRRVPLTRPRLTSLAVRSAADPIPRRREDAHYAPRTNAASMSSARKRPPSAPPSATQSAAPRSARRPRSSATGSSSASSSSASKKSGGKRRRPKRRRPLVAAAAVAMVAARPRRSSPTRRSGGGRRTSTIARWRSARRPRLAACLWRRRARPRLAQCLRAGSHRLTRAARSLVPTPRD